MTAIMLIIITTAISRGSAISTSKRKDLSSVCDDASLVVLSVVNTVYDWARRKTKWAHKNSLNLYLYCIVPFEP